MQEYLLRKYQRGEIKSSDNEGTIADVENRRDNYRWTSPKREPTRTEREIKNENRTEIKSPKRERAEERREDNLPPPPRRRINIIMRGSPQLPRVAVTTEGSRAAGDNTTNSQIKHLPITFNNQDSTGLDAPHNDPVVFTLTIADCEVSRILVDTGSSIDVIFRKTLRKMEVDESKRNPWSATCETPPCQKELSSFQCPWETCAKR